DRSPVPAPDRSPVPAPDRSPVPAPDRIPGTNRPRRHGGAARGDARPAREFDWDEGGQWPFPGRGGAGTAAADAAAAGLAERSAAAYVAGVPDDPADAGFFGPDSVTWRVSTDLGRPVAGLRALMLQALHPLAMAGVDQHSNWRMDPVGRLAATSGYLATITVGDRAAAERAAARVRRIHEHITGTDTITGQRYEASDPALLLWVHATLVESGIVAAGMFGTALSAQDADGYAAEMVAAAEL